MLGGKRCDECSANVDLRTCDQAGELMAVADRAVRIRLIEKAWVASLDR